MKRFHQSKLSFGMGRDTGQEEEAERKRNREGDEDERGRAGMAQDGPRIGLALCPCAVQHTTNKN